MDETRVELPCDSGMNGDAVAMAEMVWTNLPTRVPWTSLATHEKALVCHTLARLTRPTDPGEDKVEAVADIIEECGEWCGGRSDALALARTIAAMGHTPPSGEDGDALQGIGGR
jgi:hypothetical protein